MYPRFKTILATQASIAVLMIATASPALAQSEVSAGDSVSELQEIVVTAQKRGERLSDVPLSITAASGDQLMRRGISDTAQLERLVPGLTYQQSSYGVPVFTIRGVGFFDTTLGVSPTVSVYVDQVPLPFSAMTRGATLDIQRVEVLKGPQGTLFGQNSTGGAINYIAARPTPGFQAGGSLSYGRFNAIDADAYLSGPLSDTLSARVAVRTEQRDNWQKSQTRNDGLGQKNFLNGRLLLDWKPSDKLSLEINISGWRDKSDTQAPQFKGFAPLEAGTTYAPLIAGVGSLPAAPDSLRIADWDSGQSFARDDRFYLAAARADWELLEDVKLTSITAYSRYRTHAPSDVDGTAYTDLLITLDGLITSFSQELRLSGDTGSGLRWMLGGNYQKDHADERNSTLTGTSVAHIGPLRFSQLRLLNDQRITTKAVFGSVDVPLGSTLVGQLSTRYTDQDRRYAGCAADSGNGELAAALGLLSSFATGSFPVIPVIPAGGCVTLSSITGLALPVVRSSLDENNLSWRASLNWKPDTATLVYANVTKGYKAGAYPTLAAAFDTQVKPVPQESVLAFELGFKKSLFDRLVQLNAAGFYYDYKRKQVLGYGIVPGFGNLPQLVSIPTSRIWGAELELTLNPTAGLRVTGGVTYVNSRVRSNPVNPTDAFGNASDFVGEQFPNSPKWQFIADVEHQLPISNDLNAFIGGSVSARTGSYAAFGEPLRLQTPGAPRALRIGGYALLDLRAGIASSDGRWEFQLWGRNITNSYHLNNAAHLGDTVVFTTGMPATYGATIKFAFR